MSYGNSVHESRRPPAEKVSEVVSDSPRKGLLRKSNVGQLKKSGSRLTYREGQTLKGYRGF